MAGLISRGEPSLVHLAVARTARLAVLGADVASPRAVWIVLHGYRQLAHRFIRRFAAFHDGTRRIVAPEALNRFYLGDPTGRHGPEARVGGTWMTRHDRDAEIADQVAYLDAVASRERVGVPLFVLGFSQGQHVAARWVTLGQTRPAGVVFWGDVMPSDLPVDQVCARFGGCRVATVHGDADPNLTPELLAADDARWREWQIEPERVRHAGAHELEPEALARVIGGFEAGLPVAPPPADPA